MNRKHNQKRLPAAKKYSNVGIGELFSKRGKRSPGKRPHGKSETQAFESLEPRLLFSADAGMAFAEFLPADTPAVVAQEQPVADDFGIDDTFLEQFDLRRAMLERFAIDIPSANLEQPQLTVVVDGQSLRLNLERALTTRGDDFGVLLQQSDGSFTEFEVGAESTYVGQVDGWPGLTVNAVISSRGLSAEAYYSDGRLAWTVTPTDQLDAAGRLLHIADTTDIYQLLEANHDHDGDGVADHGVDEHDPPHPPGCGCVACCGVSASPVGSVESVAALSSPGATVSGDVDPPFGGVSSAAVRDTAPDGRILVPDNPASRAAVFSPVQVRRAVIGFDVTNESFREAYNNNVQAVLDNIALFLVTNERVSSSGQSPNTVFLRDALVQQVAGLIIIRTDVNSDPYADGNGDADITGGLLSSFRDRWNGNADSSNPSLVTGGEASRLQSNHDLATLLGGSDGTADGFGFVGTVNQGNRYSVSDGSRVGFWRSVARHEIGHTYGLRHFGDDDRRAEFDPGGNGVGLFDPMGLRNRFTTDELEVVRAEILSSNLPIINSGAADAGTFTDHPVRPNSVRDDVQLVGGTPLTIDVLANDFDANNDRLFIQRFDGLSEQGGLVEVSIGTGDQGQDELVYTPPTGFTGVDSFFYFASEAVDGPQFTQFGLVTVEVSGPTSVDPDQDIYFYDLGTSDSPIFDDNSDPYQRISEETFGDLGFEILPNDDGFVVESRDREANSQIPNVNDLNRDHIRLRSAGSFHHALTSGVYDVLLTVGDATEVTSPIRFTAEGSVTVETISHAPADHTNYFLRDVLVTDGQLDIDIENLGFTANISRIIITRVGEAPSTVDTTQTEFFFDLGTRTSPLFNGNDDPYQRLTDQTNGDLGFSSVANNAFVSIDRGAGQGANNINRDLVRFSAASSFRHVLENGIYSVLVTVGDVGADSDAITLTAEDSFSLTTNSLTASDAATNYTLQNVTVTDGELNLDIEGADGGPFESSVTRIIIRQLSDLPDATIVGRQLFYNDSSFDTVSDNDAVATDKQALLPGETATYANYTNFTRGINGIFIDIDSLQSADELTAADFEFRTGAGSQLSDFTSFAGTFSVSVSLGEGVGGSDRIALITDNQAITNTWLQVTVLANQTIGLADNDVFYFGNIVGETGNSTSDTRVNSIDLLLARRNQTAGGQSASLNNSYDVDRNGNVNAIDLLQIRRNQTAGGNEVPLITAPGGGDGSNSFQLPPNSSLVTGTSPSGNSNVNSEVPARKISGPSARVALPPSVQPGELEPIFLSREIQLVAVSVPPVVAPTVGSLSSGLSADAVLATRGPIPAADQFKVLQGSIGLGNDGEIQQVLNGAAERDANVNGENSTNENRDHLFALDTILIDGATVDTLGVSK